MADILNKLSEINGTVKFICSNQWIVREIPGVYLIGDLSGTFYVGKSNNIRRRFIEHLEREKNLHLKLTLKNPIGDVHFSWIESDLADIDILERELINLLNPKCNVIKYEKEEYI